MNAVTLVTPDFCGSIVSRKAYDLAVAHIDGYITRVTRELASVPADSTDILVDFRRATIENMKTELGYLQAVENAAMNFQGSTTYYDEDFDTARYGTYTTFQETTYPAWLR